MKKFKFIAVCLLLLSFCFSNAANLVSKQNPKTEVCKTSISVEKNLCDNTQIEVLFFDGKQKCNFVSYSKEKPVKILFSDFDEFLNFNQVKSPFKEKLNKEFIPDIKWLLKSKGIPNSNLLL